MIKIKLSKPVDFGEGKTFDIIELRDLTAGVFMQASRELPEGASRMEQEARCAAICSDVPFVVFEAMHPADMTKFGDWYDAQWSLPKADTAKNDTEGDDEALGKVGSSLKG